MPWDNGESNAAAQKCFDDWLQKRGTTGSLEEEDAVACIRSVIATNGPTKFSRPLAALGEADLSWGNSGRFGFVQNVRKEPPRYCFFPDAWKEACAGRDPDFVADALKRRGFLVHDKGRRNLPVKIKTRQGDQDVVKQIRMFAVSESILYEPEEHEKSARSTLSW
ncbi:MAG: hypothetical protein IPM06_06775 [Rhizobiales bacterium]|nr:hypothetical protein [Hyphomicrobiales bacterium]